MSRAYLDARWPVASRNLSQPATDTSSRSIQNGEMKTFRTGSSWGLPSYEPCVKRPPGTNTIARPSFVSGTTLMMGGEGMVSSGASRRSPAAGAERSKRMRRGEIKRAATWCVRDFSFVLISHAPCGFAVRFPAGNALNISPRRGDASIRPARGWRTPPESVSRLRRMFMLRYAKVREAGIHQMWRAGS